MVTRAQQATALVCRGAAVACIGGAGAGRSRSSSTPSRTSLPDCIRCWKPPPASQANPIDITVIVSFNREGAILGHPRITYEFGTGQRQRPAAVPDRRDGDIATLHAVAIYRRTGRCGCRPAFRGPFQNPQTSTPNPKRKEHG